MGDIECVLKYVYSPHGVPEEFSPSNLQSNLTVIPIDRSQRTQQRFILAYF